MTTDTYLVAFEGGPEGDKLLDFAVSRAKRDGAKLVVAHVLEWSAYSFLTPSEIEERHGRRKEEMTRGKEVILDPAVARAKAAGVDAEGTISFGNVVETIGTAARDSGASMVFVGRSGASGISSRVFGSVTIGLAETCPVPLVIVP